MIGASGNSLKVKWIKFTFLARTCNLQVFTAHNSPLRHDDNFRSLVSIWIHSVAKIIELIQFLEHAIFTTVDYLSRLKFSTYVYLMDQKR